MSNRVSADLELYAVSVDSQPSLNGGRCRACGYVFFPSQSHGCESCGALPDQLERMALAGNGVLHSFATVRVYQGKGIEAPFTVGVIALDDGPVIHSILTARTDEGLRVGDRMHSVLVPAGTDESGREIVELRFARREAGR